MSRITEVVPEKEYCVTIYLDNGSKVIWNMERRLKTARFGRLIDKDFFQTVTTDGICIRWGKVIEVSISEIFLFIQK